MKSRIPFSHVEGSCRSYIEIGLSDTGLTRPSYLFHLVEHAAKMRSLLNSIVDGEVCVGSRIKPLLRYVPLHRPAIFTFQDLHCKVFHIQ